MDLTAWEVNDFLENIGGVCCIYLNLRGG